MPAWWPAGTSTGDRAVGELAARQHGVVTRQQLGAAGMRRGAIAHRLREGRLHRLHRGVYLVGHPVRPPLAIETAALLACGKGAVLSHHPAGRLLAVLPPEGTEIDVTVAARDPGPLKGVRIHRARRLDPRDLTRRQGLPITAPARTLLDLAEVLAGLQLERALEEALRRRVVSDKQLRALLARSPGRHGVAVLGALLDRREGPALTRSEAEARLLALVREARLPPAELNVHVGRFEVDFLWRDAGLVVEVDGYAYHSGPAAFERDRLRDAELQSLGLAVLRVNWRQIVDEPHALVARLVRALTRPHERLSSGEWR